MFSVCGVVMFGQGYNMDYVLALTKHIITKHVLALLLKLPFLDQR